MAFVGVACPELDLSTAIQRKECAVLAAWCLVGRSCASHD